MTVVKYPASSSGDCFKPFLIHHCTILTKLPEIWLIRKSCGISPFAEPSPIMREDSDLFKYCLKKRRNNSPLSQLKIPSMFFGCPADDIGYAWSTPQVSQLQARNRAYFPHEAYRKKHGQKSLYTFRAINRLATHTGNASDWPRMVNNIDQRYSAALSRFMANGLQSGREQNIVRLADHHCDNRGDCY